LKDRASDYRTKAVLAATGALIAALVILVVLFDPLSWLRNAGAAASIRAELSAARERWRSQEITDYRIDVEGFVPLACVVNVTLSVREGELVGVEGRGMPGHDTEGESVEPEDWDAPYCSYREMLVPEMYVRIERELDGIEWSRDTLEAEFDPQYGYVTEYRYDCCYRRGLLNPACADCDIWFSFSNFELVTDS